MKPFSYLFYMFVLAITAVALPKIDAPIIDQEIGEAIFHENKLYMIFVCRQPSQKAIEIFNQYCHDDNTLCAVLSPEVDRYWDFRNFIGEKDNQYFAILDVQRRKKYVLPIIDQMTANDIRIFQSKFQQGTLTPFYSSQEPEKTPYQKCQKLVSKNLDEFLSSQSQLKVVFLYTQHSACEVCGQMLRQFADLAQKLYDKQIVSFGYYDIFRNDHPKITDEILPFFLIFAKGKDEPYGVAGEKFHQLEETIIQIALKDTDINLDKFRREHTLNMNGEKMQAQYQKSYKIKQNEIEQESNLQQL